MKFRYIVKKRWQPEDFRFNFLPSIGFSGQSNSDEFKRVIALKWFCFSWYLEWYRKREEGVLTNLKIEEL